MADTNKFEEHVDPVCKMRVREDQAAATDTYEGEKYYFCSNECKDEFQSQPDTYATSVVPRRT